jgi:branched-chain amino acid transport system substrate-binding protein
VRTNKGSLADTKAVVMAMRKAEYDSIRGPFKWNVNQHPIQDFFLLRAEKGKDGNVEMKIQKKVFDDHKDSYYQDCKMPW